MQGFYLDEQASERLTEALERLGHDATSAARLGNKKLSDAAQLLISAELRRVLVSYDVKDFKLLQEAWHAWPRAWSNIPRPSHSGILLIHSSMSFDITDVADVIDQIAQTYDAIDNRLFVRRPRCGWHEVT